MTCAPWRSRSQSCCCWSARCGGRACRVHVWPTSVPRLTRTAATQAIRSFQARVAAYFRGQGAALAALPAARRAAFLRDRCRDVGDPSCAGSMNAMPSKGRSGGLPAVFDVDDDGALHVSDDEVVVLD